MSIKTLPNTTIGDYKCFDGAITVGDNGNIYGYDDSTGSIVTVNTNTQEVKKGLTLPFTRIRSLAYLGTNFYFKQILLSLLLLILLI